MNRIDPRVKQLVRENKNTRLHILMVLWAMDAPSTAADIATEILCSPKQVSALLPGMESEGYVSRVGAGRHPRWTLTDKAQQLTLPGLLHNSDRNKVPVNPLLLSSDPIISSESESDQNQTEEEEGSTPEERAAIADRHRLTGRYREVVLADQWITARRFDGWLAAAEGKRNPAAYAVTCCSNHDEPPEQKQTEWDADLERYKQSPVYQRMMENRSHDT